MVCSSSILLVSLRGVLCTARNGSIYFGHDFAKRSLLSLSFLDSTSALADVCVWNVFRRIPANVTGHLVVTEFKLLTRFALLDSCLGKKQCRCFSIIIFKEFENRVRYPCRPDTFPDIVAFFCDSQLKVRPDGDFSGCPIHLRIVRVGQRLDEITLLVLLHAKIGPHN